MSKIRVEHLGFVGAGAHRRLEEIRGENGPINRGVRSLDYWNSDDAHKNAIQPDFLGLPVDRRLLDNRQPNREYINRDDLLPYSMSIPLPRRTLRGGEWRIGVELEFSNPWGPGLSPDFFYMKTGWAPCYDASCGFELKGPAFQMNLGEVPNFLPDDIYDMMVERRTLPGSFAGGHIHISHRSMGRTDWEEIYECQAENLNVFLSAMYPARASNRYSAIKYHDRTPMGKYQAYRIKGERMEIRSFPAHNDPDILARRVALAVSLLQVCRSQMAESCISPAEFCVKVLEAWSGFKEPRVRLSARWIRSFMRRAAAVWAIYNCSAPSEMIVDEFNNYSPVSIS